MKDEIQKHAQESGLPNDNKKVTDDHKLTLDAQGLVLEATSNVLGLLGRKEEDLIGKSIINYIHEEDRDNFTTYLEDLSQPPFSGACEI